MNVNFAQQNWKNPTDGFGFQSIKHMESSYLDEVELTLVVSSNTDDFHRQNYSTLKAAFTPTCANTQYILTLVVC